MVYKASKSHEQGQGGGWERRGVILATSGEMGRRRGEEVRRSAKAGAEAGGRQHQRDGQVGWSVDRASFLAFTFYPEPADHLRRLVCFVLPCLRTTHLLRTSVEPLLGSFVVLREELLIRCYPLQPSLEYWPG